MVPILTAVWERGDFDGGLALFDQAIKDDPNNLQMWRLYAMAEQRKKMDGEIQQLQTKLAAQPKSRETLQQLVTFTRISATRTSAAAAAIARSGIFRTTATCCATSSHTMRRWETWGARSNPPSALRDREIQRPESPAAGPCLLRAAEEEGILRSGGGSRKNRRPERAEHAALRTALAPWREEPEFKKLTTPQPLISQ